MKIYVTRHGITELNKKKIVNAEVDEPLAPEGIEQAKAVIQLTPKSVTHIYSSSLMRARQTADIIAAKLYLPISIHHELSEIHMGSLAGYSWEEMESGLELKKKHRAVQFDYRPYGGESVEDVKKRLIPFFGKINNKHGDYQALIITHGGMIRLITMLGKGEIVEETEKHLSFLTFDLDKILKKSK